MLKQRSECRHHAGEDLKSLDFAIKGAKESLHNGVSDRGCKCVQRMGCGQRSLGGCKGGISYHVGWRSCVLTQPRPLKTKTSTSTQSVLPDFWKSFVGELSNETRQNDSAATKRGADEYKENASFV